MRSHPRLSRLDLPAYGGLRPRAWLVTENGVSREDVKEFLLQSGLPFVSEAVLDVQSLCLRVLEGLATKERVLGATTRQEVLRNLLRETFREREWTELRKLRHQRGFYKKLDRSLQALRMTYGTEEERRAQLERLGEYPSALRAEVNELVVLYEDWLAREKLWDLPRLLLAAGAVCSDAEIPVRLPERIQLLSPKEAESRFEFFFDELGRRTEVERIFLVDPVAEAPEEKQGNQPSEGKSLRSTSENVAELSKKCSWDEWHTLDDAAENLADELARAAAAGELGDHGVLIPDLPEVRRTLMRALARTGVPLRDPRDPTQVRTEEAVKRALLPLRLVVSGVPQRLLVEWLRADPAPPPEEPISTLLEALFEQGEREGVTPQFRAVFPRTAERLNALTEKFTGKRTASEWATLHLEHLASESALESSAARAHRSSDARGRRSSDAPSSDWTVEFFASVWRQYAFDLSVIGERDKRRPLKYFFERFENRVWEATPPIEKLQFPKGLELFRLGTTPVRLPKKLWAFGLPARWTSLEEIGDYALSARDREVLAGSFLIRSSGQEGRFRRQSLRLWIAEADSVTFVDATNAFDARERETIGPLLRELGLDLQPRKRGATPKFLSSFLSRLDAPERDIELTRESRKIIPASALEAYSRCAFQSLLRSRWKLRELRESDLDVRPDAKGILLHSAAHALLSSRGPDGAFAVTPAEAFERALAHNALSGQFRSPRLERLTRRECIRALEDFAAKERAWWEIARTEIYRLEGPELLWEKHGVTIRGRPDRVDAHPDGLFIIDYKSGSDSPAAADSLNKGYRLQLPIYALALRAQTGEEVLGYQFVPLKTRASRTTGLATPAHAGKGPGALLQSTRKSKSLLEGEDLDTIWSRFEERIDRDILGFVEGRFRVEPRKATECDRCFARDACGQRRFPAVGIAIEEEGGVDVD